MKVFLEWFPAHRILVVETEALLRRRDQALRGIFEFLSVDPEFRSAGFRIERHHSSLKRRKTRIGSWLVQRGLERRLDTLPQPWRWQFKFFQAGTELPKGAAPLIDTKATSSVFQLVVMIVVRSVATLDRTWYSSVVKSASEVSS